jgi:Helix-turn-helix domain
MKSTLANQLAVLSDDPLLKLSDALPLLGGINRSTAMHWHRRGKLALVKVGHHYRIRASELLRVSKGGMCHDPAPSAATNSAP